MSSWVVYIVVGGGIAGVSCTHELQATISRMKSQSKYRIIIISASQLVKMITNATQVGRVLETFDICETPIDAAFTDSSNITVIRSKVTLFNSAEKYVQLEDGRRIEYTKICIATGASPKKVIDNMEYVLTIRDTETVDTLQRRIVNCRRIVIVGNGGIATELVYELKNIDVIWAVKHSSIAATFVDPGAAQFFLETIENRHPPTMDEIDRKRSKYTVSSGDADDRQRDVPILGAALGPDWSHALKLCGCAETPNRQLHIVYNVELIGIHSPSTISDTIDFDGTSFPSVTDWRTVVELSNGQRFGCDLIVLAIGVRPNTDPWTINNPQLKIADHDGGLIVDNRMETSIRDVYAAGDVCSAGWNYDNTHWMQMRLWTQAKQMGEYAARCMIDDNRSASTNNMDICFELFTHVTSFFNFKVILLGKFNGQNVPSPWRALVRYTAGVEYLKVIVSDSDNGRVQVDGAVLIGETNLEETIENLILNRTDISAIEQRLLDPDIDIEDYFD